MDKIARQSLFSWLVMVAMLALFTCLGILQYRWIGDVARAEQDRLRVNLQATLRRLGADFNTEITSACTALWAEEAPGDEREREIAYIKRFTKWRESTRHDRLFSRVAIAQPDGQSIDLKMLDVNSAAFRQAEWPAAWSRMHSRLSDFASPDGAGRRNGFGPFEFEANLIELPRFNEPMGEPGQRGPRPQGRPGVSEWLILEIDLDYVRGTLLPELLQRHLGGDGAIPYEAEVLTRGNPPVSIFHTNANASAHIGAKADASVMFFDTQFMPMFGRMMGARGGRPNDGKRERDREQTKGGPPMMEPPFMGDRGRWQMVVRHRAGSLEAVVMASRNRNLAVTAGIFVLMLGALASLIQSTRRAQRLAQLQMDFVAGVSHELRTPLSVITSAAYNLKAGVVNNPQQLRRYGTLIHDESVRLVAMVEQVLRFAALEAGRATGRMDFVDVPVMIDSVLRDCTRSIEEAGCTVEKNIEENLPRLYCDEAAIRHALQNLIFNAAKYGKAGGWIGVAAACRRDGDVAVMEFRVSDRGPGIPPEERKYIFEPFYRGKKAIANQIHGNGLGLNLAKRIVKAHKGAITAISEAGQGATLLVAIPVVMPGGGSGSSDFVG